MLIPQSKIDFFYEKCDKDYTYTFDNTKGLKNKKISREANSILISLYQEFFADGIEKERVLNILKDNEKRFKKEFQIDFEPDKVFNKRHSEDIEQSKIDNREQLVTYNKSFFKRIIGKIKSIMKKV